MIGDPPSSPLFPYPTLSRSDQRRRRRIAAVDEDGADQRLAHVGERCQAPPPARVRFRIAEPQGCAEIDRARDIGAGLAPHQDRKSTRLNSSHLVISYAVFCL